MTINCVGCALHRCSPIPALFLNGISNKEFVQVTTPKKAAEAEAGDNAVCICYKCNFNKNGPLSIFLSLIDAAILSGCKLTDRLSSGI